MKHGMGRTSQDSRKLASARLQAIPGVGPAMAEDLLRLGFESPEELAGQDPEELYRRMTILSGGSLDRCVLYVFRLAVWWAGGGPARDPDPERLKWWNWSDANLSGQQKKSPAA